MLRSSYIDPSQPLIDYSPPTKWPRATTPVNVRSVDPSILGTSSDSGVGLNLTFNSPPIVNRMDQNRCSPGLRTPTSRPGIHMSTTPSPFRSFRLSSFTSPTLSDRALRLSNSENVVGFRYRDGSIEKNVKIADMTTPRHSGIVGPLKVSRQIDDSGLFGSDVDHYTTSTPLQSSPQSYLNCSTSTAVVHNPYADICRSSKEEVPSTVTVTKSSPPTPSSFKRAMRDVQRQGMLQPRKLLTDNTNIPMMDKEFPEKQLPLMKKIEEDEVVNRQRGCSISETFNVPRKPLKPYSRRWMRLVTGGTRSQRELTAAAHSFIARLPHINNSW
ncbi:hypothetical protein DICVIV_09535 [Dictyocaulus viviparus]|uniref:Uncharacterized protein n=1 Tax=Dictyocaulus viviparus TaxID=29172 RepID=A0A0D8XPX9_DICVI|nr:hypothetical protein DICVIV_09535 [Dictyocaulus viviparus]